MKKYLKYILKYGLLVSLLFLVYKFGCPIFEWFKISCPACGVTHAWRSLLRGEIAEAFKSNAFFIPLTALFLRIIYADLRNRRIKKTEYIIYIAFAVLVFVYNVFRNIKGL